MIRISYLLSLLLIAGPSLCLAQSKAQVKPPAKKTTPPAKEKPPAKPMRPLVKDGKPVIPATIEEAAKVLDLCDFPRMEGETRGGTRSLAYVGYAAKTSTSDAYDFQKQQLEKLGFQEIHKSYRSENSHIGYFFKDGFLVSASTENAGQGQEDKGWSRISLMNIGNVAVERLPVPPGFKANYSQLETVRYATKLDYAEAFTACRKLLLDQGWEPYGVTASEKSKAENFKRNAVRLRLSSSPDDNGMGGKSSVSFRTELLSADLPVPPDVTKLKYQDFYKTLEFSEPAEKADSILAFYKERLPKQGWQATTDRPVEDVSTKSKLFSYRNAQSDLLTLTLNPNETNVLVSLKYQTAAEVAADERNLQEIAELRKKKELERIAKKSLVVPLFPNTKPDGEQRDNYLVILIPQGRGFEILKWYGDHLEKQGWKIERRLNYDGDNAIVHFKKEDPDVELKLELHVIDKNVLTRSRILISGLDKLTLEPVAEEKNASKSDKPATPK